MMKMGEAADHQDEDTSAEVDYLMKKQTAQRKAIVLRDEARQAVVHSKGEMNCHQRRRIWKEPRGSLPSLCDE